MLEGGGGRLRVVVVGWDLSDILAELCDVCTCVERQVCRYWETPD